MTPRKRAFSSSSSRNANQSNQPSQPSKFGIQHFFECLPKSQVAAVSSANPNPNPDRPECTQSPGDQTQPLHAAAAAAADVVENVTEISPEVSKSVQQKRFKFSPGMENVWVEGLIKSGRRHEAEALSPSMDQKNLGIALAELLHRNFLVLMQANYSHLPFHCTEPASTKLGLGCLLQD